MQEARAERAEQMEGTPKQIAPRGRITRTALAAIAGLGVLGTGNDACADEKQNTAPVEKRTAENTNRSLPDHAVSNEHTIQWTAPVSSEEEERFQSAVLTFVRLRARAHAEWKAEVEEAKLAERALGKDGNLQALHTLVARHIEENAYGERLKPLRAAAKKGDVEAIAAEGKVDDWLAEQANRTVGNTIKKAVAIRLIEDRYRKGLTIRAEQLSERIGKREVTVEDLRRAIRTLIREEDTRRESLLVQDAPVVAQPVSATVQSEAGN